MRFLIGWVVFIGCVWRNLDWETLAQMKFYYLNELAFIRITNRIKLSRKQCIWKTENNVIMVNISPGKLYFKIEKGF